MGRTTARSPGAARPIGRFASPGLSLHRIVDGRIVEDWEYGDDLAVLSDLGFRIEPPEVAETQAAG